VPALRQHTAQTVECRPTRCAVGACRWRPKFLFPFSIRQRLVQTFPRGCESRRSPSIQLEPHVSSLAQWRVHSRWGNAKHNALAEATLYAGLRRAGCPEE
jgi:hypothetical protein